VDRTRMKAKPYSMMSRDWPIRELRREVSSVYQYTPWRAVSADRLTR